MLGVESEKFEHRFNEHKAKLGVTEDTHVDAGHAATGLRGFQSDSPKGDSQEFPTNPQQQLELAIRAVFASGTAGARDYRRTYKIADDLGTAVNVVTMVFGNMGEDSGTGVAFTRDVSTGERKLYGEYLQNAQGEDVVAGIRTPKKIAQLQSRCLRCTSSSARSLSASRNTTRTFRSGIHDRARQALDAPDAQRQTYRPSGRADCGRNG